MDVNTLLAQAAANDADQSKGTEGPSFEVAPAGPTPARFIGYVEVGKHPQEFEGKAKPPALEAYLFFELNGKHHRREVEKDGVTTEYTNRAMVHLTVSTNVKSGFYKLFQTMRNERENIKNMAQMLGEAFLITVVHGKSKDGKKTYVNLRNDTGWLVKPPLYAPDPLDPADLRPLPVNQPTQPLMLLLWDFVTKEQWESIFIDGTRTTKKDGVEVQVSKNWLQETCLAATNFEGSPLEAMLNGMGGFWKDLRAKVAAEGASKSEEAQEPEKEAADPLAGKASDANAGKVTQVDTTANAGTVEPEKKPEPTKTASPQPAGDASDVLASLGL